MARLPLIMLAIAALFVSCPAVHAQTTSPCDTPAPPAFISDSTCNEGLNLQPGQFQATPLVDGTGQSYGDPDNNKVSLYGSYGNIENSGNAQTHWNTGYNVTSNIVPRCTDGSTSTPCPDGKQKAIVFLFLGFSNCDIEICGGNTDIWDAQHDDSSQTVNGHLPGQPCATTCQNPRNPAHVNPWNQVTYAGGDGKVQQSFLYQVYSPSTPLVGSDVVIFDGAMGQQTLDHWDPTPIGFFAQAGNYCNFGHQGSVNPECNYDRVFDDLYRNGLSEAQVQAIFLKTSDEYPRCDLKQLYCDRDVPQADAYLSEIYLGNILRYLRCCKFGIQGSPGNVPRYPNLQQVFLTSRIYGGYANGTAHGCLMPEPYAYEEGFAIQRMIVAQINSTADTYSGDVHYNPNPTPGGAPWFDWGPYIWASGPNQSPGSGLVWCDTTTDPHLYPACSGDTGTLGDFRWGDLTPGYSQFWGDHTHPSYIGAGKVATQLVKFIQGTLPYPQGGTSNPNNISNWILPWITR